MMNIIITISTYLCAVLLLSSPLYAQHPRVLYNSQDIYTEEETSPIKRINERKLSASIKVVYEDGKKEEISKDAIWGITDKKGNVFRYYKNGFYEVADIGDIVQYRVPDHYYIESAAVPTTHIMYSKTLNSEIYNFKKKAERDTIKNDE